jgi:hypothetical protein
MRKAQMNGAQFGGCVGSGSAAAPVAADWLSLGAAPVFALMALWTSLLGQPDLFCVSMHGTWSLSGMALMYTLMSIFHVGPWVKLISSRQNGTQLSRHEGPERDADISEYGKAKPVVIGPAILEQTFANTARG